MALKNASIRTFFYSFFTLKKRIILVFIISLSISFLSIALISGYAISSILTNKLQAGIKSNLNQVRLSLENNISNLNSVSLQLSAMGTVGKEMGQFLFSKQPYERSQLLHNMKDEITTISYTNPSVGLIMYYFKKNNSTLLENSVVKDDFSIKRLPVLAAYYGVTYYGPHISNNRFSNQYVLSALMKLDAPSEDDVYAYVETGFKLTQNILDKDQVGVNTFHIMLDNNSRIAYSEIPKAFKLNTIFHQAGSHKFSGLEKNYYWFKSQSNQGWSIISLIAKAEYNKERNLWIKQMFLLSILFLIIIIVISLVLWKMVSNPLNKFNKELDWIEQGEYNTKLTPTNIPEFDSLLEKFHIMKKQILNLFSEVKNKEKLRADLEIEKLGIKSIRIFY
jgi:two-component system sensor histidine kinase YesM